MKSHLQSYPCPLQINSFWNLGFLLGITIILQIITGILLGLHYCSDLYSAYSSIFFFIREIYYGWCLRYLHSCGASFVFLFLFLHLGRAISYASYFYNPNTWFSGILLLFFLMAIAFMGFLIFYCWTTFHLDAAVVQVSKPLSNKVNRFLSSNLLQVSSSHISCFLELFFLSFDQDLECLHFWFLGCETDEGLLFLKSYYFWNFTKYNLWEPINDLCHVLYFSSWKSCMGTSYVYCRFRN